MWKNFRKMALKYKIVKTLKIPPSTPHNIIKIFRESGLVSVDKGQGWRSKLDTHDLQGNTVITMARKSIISTVVKTGKIRPEIIVCNHSLLCNSQMQVKPVSYKEEAINKHNPEMSLCSLSQSSCKMVWGKTKICHVLRTKEERDHPACYQQRVQKPSSVVAVAQLVERVNPLL